MAAVATGGASLPQPYLLGQDADGVRRLVLDASAAGDALAEQLAGAGLQVLLRCPDATAGSCSSAVSFAAHQDFVWQAFSETLTETCVTRHARCTNSNELVACRTACRLVLVR